LKSIRRAVDFRLYLITDRKLFADVSLMIKGVEEALEGGVGAVQLREKDLEVRQLLELAYRMRETTAKYRAKLFINDRVDVALAVGADGLHLAGTSMPVSGARQAAGEDMLIGVSVHSPEEAGKAEDEGADFVTMGPIYETPSKMSYGRPLGPGVFVRSRGLSVPVFAIGGITEDKVAALLGAGAYGIAVISAILTAGDIKSTTEGFMRLLK